MEACLGLLFWFCLALGLFGIATMVIGIIVQLMYFDGSAFIATHFLAAPSLLIFIGVVLFVVAFLGCCGASKKSHFLLMTFAVLMFCLFILGFAGSIACYYYRAQVETQVQANFNETITKYPTSETARKSWDIMQHELKCCGIMGQEDWKNILNITVPISCCDGIPKGDTSLQPACNTGDIYTEGCMMKLIDVVKSQSVVLGVVAILVSLTQILIVIFTCYLAGSIRSEYQTV